MTRLHPAAEQGFGEAAARYERGRPGYPRGALEHLGRRLELGPGRTVIDLAAGTGKLTRALLASGSEVIAVEPVAAMRGALPKEATVLDGTAERIPVAAGAADAVTVGQAFHWFDGDAALAEIHRVLRPGGTLALLWNRLVEEERVGRAFEALLARYRPGVPTYRGDAWRAAFERTRLFGPLEERYFRNEQIVDADGMADRVGSMSFIASLPAAERERVLDGARALASPGPVKIPYRTGVHVCDRLE
jgi:ubiquinone/menaquinone biosynthesis C-methylase UbiE